MSEKVMRIVSRVLAILVSLMLAMSAVFKLIAPPPVVEGLTKAGMGNYIALLGIIELLCVILFVIPKTYKIGFFLLCSYLGGAMSIEMAGGQLPTAGILLAVVWISVFLRERSMFFSTSR